MSCDETTLFHMFLETYEKNKEKKAFIYKIAEQEFQVSYEKLFEDVLVLSRALKAKKNHQRLKSHVCM